MIPVRVICVGLCEPGSGKEEVELCSDIGLVQGELPVQDVKEFPFHTADIALSKQSGPRCPIRILW